MNKLAERISAQDIIRANSQAEAKEAERIKLEAEQYKAQMEAFKQSAEEYKNLMEQIKTASEEYKNILEGMRNDSGNYRENFKEMQEDLKEYKQKFESNETKIHDVGVQIYRNVQAVVEREQEKNKEQFKELFGKIESLNYAVERKNSAVLPLTIITMILVIADLAFNILRFLGVF